MQISSLLKYCFQIYASDISRDVIKSVLSGHTWGVRIEVSVSGWS